MNKTKLAGAIGGLFIAPGAALAVCPVTITTTVSSALTEQQCYDNESVTVTPTGSITVTDTVSTSVVLISANPYSGTFTNSGSISGSFAVNTGYAERYGLQIQGTISGRVSNAGSLSVVLNMDGGGSNAEGHAYSFVANFVEPGASISNTGTISARTDVRNAQNGFAEAYGVILGGGIAGTVGNSGSISATASAAGTDYAQVFAYGARVGGIGAGASLTNSGSLVASASGMSGATSNGAYVNAEGLTTNNTLDGSISNSGTIRATATASGGGIGSTFGNGYGIRIFGSGIGLTGTLTNTGTISGDGTARGSGSTVEAYGEGIEINGSLNGMLSNAGTVSGTATSDGRAYAYGIVNWGPLPNGSLNNSGSITATATGTTAAYAYGVSVWNTVNGTITNSGTIRATGQSGAAMGEVYGIYINPSHDGTINNSGTVSATGLGLLPASNVYSIWANAGTGTVNNMAGGVLEGRVFLPGAINFNNAGSLDTRLLPSTVGGNYTQSATGVLKISAMDNATFGRVNVGGTANLAAGTGFFVKAASGHTLAAGTLSGVITSGGLTMSTATVTDNLLALNYAAVANGNNVDLVATATGISSVAATLPSGVGSIGGVLDGLLANIDAQPLELQNFLHALNTQTTSQGVADSVQKLLPMLSSGTTQAGVGASQGINNVVVARLENSQGRSAGDKFFGDRKVWLKPFGSWADQDNRDGVVGYSARTAGLVGGVDGGVGDYRLGLAFGYARSDVDGNSSAAPQNAKVDSYQLVFYGDRRLNTATDVNFQAGVGLHDNSTRRTIAFGATNLQAASTYGSVSANLGAGIAHSIKWSEKTTFTPSLRADYTWIRNGGYTESGAGALGLTVSESDFAKFIVAADGKLSHALSDRSKLVANLGLGYDLINERASVTSTLAGAPTAAFSTLGIKPSAWLVRGGVGVTFRATEAIELTTRYDAEVRTGYSNQTVSVNARWSF